MPPTPPPQTTFFKSGVRVELLYESIAKGMTFDPHLVQVHEELHALFGAK